MWVDTKGEDGPQCIHHTPVGALMVQPPPSKSCRSLQYALKNALNSTSIRVGCGTHKLESYNVQPNKFSTIPDHSVVLMIEGECATNQPTVHCQNETTATFKELKGIEIKKLVFEQCGRQEHSETGDDSPTLHFSRCTFVTLQHVTVHRTGLYGNGIVLTDVVTHGVITLSGISIFHSGRYGTGIQCDIHGNSQSPVYNFSLYMNNVQVVNTNTHTEYNSSMKFIGIEIVARGTGSGNKVSLREVTVFNSVPVSGFGLLVELCDNMHNTTVILASTNVLDGWSNHYHRRSETEILAECAQRQLEIIRSKEQYEFYRSIAVQVQTLHNAVNITNAHVIASYGPMNVYSLAVVFEGQAALNRVHLQNVTISSSGNLNIHWYGFVVRFYDVTHENLVHMRNLHVANSTTVFGKAVLFHYLGSCASNKVLLERSTIMNHTSKEVGGGSLSALFHYHAQNNYIVIFRVILKNNSAELGGGIQIILSGFSCMNRISLMHVLIFGNKAIVGGGMCIGFSNSAARNTVHLYRILIMSNSLDSTSKMSKMGGGVQLNYKTDKAMFATKNKVVINQTHFIYNEAKGGVGGGLSLLYVHSPYTEDSGDEFVMDKSVFFINQAAADYGHAFALQSSPMYKKALFRGIKSTNTFCGCTNTTLFDGSAFKKVIMLIKKVASGDYLSIYTNVSNYEALREIDVIIKNTMAELSKKVNPVFQVLTNTSLILLISVEIMLQGTFACGAASQGILAVDSEIILQPNSSTAFETCVASHGGAIAMYGESYIRLSYNSSMALIHNYAFQRGGALYVHSAQHAEPHKRCFLQHEHGQAMYNSGIVLKDNAAKYEGQSLFLSEAENCFTKERGYLYLFGQLKSSNMTYMLPLDPYQTNATYTGHMCLVDGITYPFCNGTSNISFDILPQIVSRPDHVDGVPVDLDNPLTLMFIPGKQKQLPHKHAYDILGNVINTVFTVQIITEEPTTDVQLNPFSKYTADFTVILHGIPLKHGMANSTTKENGKTRNAIPQLILQSVDNSNLMLVMNIELQCCPPGYIYRIGSGDMGTCHCGMTTVMGIEECNETDPNNIGAVLLGEHWAGYLPSNDQHSCDEQTFFSAPCPPGYCQIYKTVLPSNNSRHLLEDIVCGGSYREGLLCGDCLEGSGIAVNFNGMRPVCTSCQNGLSTVGLLVWILSEWVPMLVVMFIVMLFNIDLVSGRFNSFLLFAQLLAFSSVRGDAELGPVHIAFIKIYRFLYGMWNLDFFGVLLPPYCLIPHSRLTLLQTLLLHYSIGLFPLIVAITLIVLERSAEKWICCHRVDQCLRRMRRWKAKYSDGMSYDRALPAFVILGFTRFLVSSSYILVNQTITGEDGEERMVVWWQGSVPYGSIQHIVYFIPAIIILLVFVLLPAFLLLTLPIVPQLFGRLIIAVPPLRKLQRMQTFCSNVYTDR